VQNTIRIAAVQSPFRIGTHFSHHFLSKIFACIKRSKPPTMRLALAASILAQTLPVASSEETKSSVHLTRAARHHHLHDLLVKLNKNANNNDDEPKTEEFALSTPWLAKRLAHGGGGGPGVLKNRAIVAKNVECDPTYPHANEEDDHKEADVGILGCGIHQYCAESEASSLGGVCVTHDNRDLQDDYLLPGFSSSVCDPSSEEYGTYGDCDCTNFDNAAQEGTFVCSRNEYACFRPGYCGSYTITGAIENDVESYQFCYELITPAPTEICYGFDTTPGCTLSMAGVECTSCELVDGFVSPIFNEIQDGCYEFDCTNTDAGISGNDCLGYFLLQGAVFTPVFQCDICGDGMEITLPEAALTDFPGDSIPSCQAIRLAAESGLIPELQCPSLQPFVQASCGCMMTSASPTSMPVTRAPIAAPSLMMNETSESPTSMPVTTAPTAAPSMAESGAPTEMPADMVTMAPTSMPSIMTDEPTVAPVVFNETSMPSANTNTTTTEPSMAPSVNATGITNTTAGPSAAPTVPQTNMTNMTTEPSVAPITALDTPETVIPPTDAPAVASETPEPTDASASARATSFFSLAAASVALLAYYVN
jgi:hypothetical protein